LGHLLQPEERVRVAQFRAEADRRRALVARAALRLLLARVMFCPDPAALTIERGLKGKPWLPGGPEFNVSHGGEILLIGFSTQAALGVDVEPFSAGAAWREVVPRLHATERASVMAAADPETAFLRIWTRKEAVAKATGFGFTLDTRSWAVSGGRPSVVVPPQADEAPRDWALYDLPTVRGHIAAAAVEGPHSLRCWTLAL
jgi:4'-phosphopantetheinyl transferase